MDWLARAACRGMVDVFFPEPTHDDHGLSEAKQVCAGCPVRRECADYTAWLRPRPNHGVWAGESPSGMRRQRTAANLAKTLG